MTRGAWLAALLLAGCAGQTPAPDAAAGLTASSTTWRSAITGADRQRLARLWEAWTRSLADAKAAGQDNAMAALGPMAVADAATMNRDAADAMAPPVAGPLPGVGSYRCRTVQVGRRVDPAAAVVVSGSVPQAEPATSVVLAGDPVPCRIEARGPTLWFEIDAAGQPQRLGGRLYPDGDRLVFLGTTALAGEMGIMNYGIDPERNAVGALRAIAPAHWRLELPWPNWQSNLTLVEILPA